MRTHRDIVDVRKNISALMHVKRGYASLHELIDQLCHVRRIEWHCAALLAVPLRESYARRKRLRRGQQELKVVDQ